MTPSSEPKSPPDTAARLAELEGQHAALRDEVRRLHTQVETSTRLSQGLLEALVWLCMGAASAFVAIRMPLPDRLFWRELANAGHVAAFALVAAVLLRLSVRLTSQWMPRRVGHYVLAFVGSQVIGVLVEAIQFVGARDASIGDVVRDGLGAAGGLLICLSLDAKMQGSRPRRIRLRPVVGLLGVLLLIVGFVPLLRLTGAEAQRDAAFPVIASFGADWERRFMSVEGAELTLVDPPVDWGEPVGDSVARVIFFEGRYPGITISDISPDWTGYDRLVFTVFNPGSEPVHLTVRVHDRQHTHTYEDRFNRALELPPGLTRVAVDLADVRQGPQRRELDMTAIEGLVLFVIEPSEPIILYFNEIRLE